MRMIVNECVRLLEKEKYYIEKIPTTLIIRWGDKCVELDAKYCEKCGNLWFGKRNYCENCGEVSLYLTRFWHPRWIRRSEIVCEMVLDLGIVRGLRHVRTGRVFKIYL